MYAIEGDVLSGTLGSLSTVVPAIAAEYAATGDEAAYQQSLAALGTSMSMGFYEGMETRTYLQYKTLPFKVNQFGVSLNMDYIISSKLIAKLNVNWQQTRIDNYYRYNRNSEIANQLSAAAQCVTGGLLNGAIATDILTDGAAMMAQGKSLDDMVAAVVGYSPMFEFMDNIGYESMSEAEQEAVLNDLHQAGVAGQTYGSGDSYVERPLGMYYALKYNIYYDRANNYYYFGSSNFTQPKTVDGHKHKATPSVYGMLGLIYKPMPKLTASAFANFMGKRTYVTSYGEKELGNRCTVNAKIGYHPISTVEVFVNAHNLLNTKKQEFIYSDKIGGTYTIGVNFGF